ncbi:hypothetical protein [Escherichia coli]|uniref:hypothetical protein n=1 Tax=Escherichia coli TaxID=562 RepID=UPI00287C0CD7|nr:hypothetical protein [Escherichia coli]MEC3818213.1 hypothetical protein [Escherichia coli]HCQ8893649.1 hypothetical protein [Escherichia coli]HDX3150250.1 hypothetical protein [Escherichia coli]HDX3227670.1 hypothetical protein [Escherichia coli]
MNDFTKEPKIECLEDGTQIIYHMGQKITMNPDGKVTTQHKAGHVITMQKDNVDISLNWDAIKHINVQDINLIKSIDSKVVEGGTVTEITFINDSRFLCIYDQLGLPKGAKSEGSNTIKISAEGDELTVAMAESSSTTTLH